MASGIVIGNQNVLNKIQSFLNDNAYRNAIENSATFNTRLSIERRLRLPFLDSQTGVAQNHSNLFMTPRQRIPGLQEGQIYTYPSKRWRKKRRQYLLTFMQPRRKVEDPEADLHTISAVENPAAVNEDSKESSTLKDETTKETWFYDDLDIPDAGEFDDPDPDSDFDYEESYTKRRKKRVPKVTRQGTGVTRKKGAAGTSGAPTGRGRKKVNVNYDPASDIEKPFSCELCGARYKTRPGLTYHYTHSHKDRDDEDEEGKNPSPKASRDNSNSSSGDGTMTGSKKLPDSFLPGQRPPGRQKRRADGITGVTRRGRQPGIPPQPPPPAAPPPPPPVLPAPVILPPILDDTILLEKTIIDIPEKDRAQPSPYCDFCLGDSSQNTKTGQSEELVSCSDCGRSGHPSCLKFTPNMIISVRKYRWQCIECKCCSICGTSDNDDQLLFCDDCDRGYHMYCLTPPLTIPPEGSWSCALCFMEFHK